MMTGDGAQKNLNKFDSSQIENNHGKIFEESPQVNDDILDIVGHDGLWQRWIFLWMLLANVIIVWHYMAMSFYAPNLDYWCSRPEGSNKTVEEWKNHHLPEDKQCARFRNQSSFYFMNDSNTNSSNSEIVRCDSWEYDTAFYSSTVLSKFDLVCKREWLVSLSTSLFNGGAILSNIIVAHLSDRFGRRPLLATCIVIPLCAGVACAFSTSFLMFAITRVLIAFGLNGILTVSFVLLMEVVGPKERSFYGVAVHFGWCVGFVCLPGVVWLLRDWFWVQMAITAPLVVLLLTFRLIPESPRWLISQGRIKEAEKITTKATKINGNYLSDIDSRLRIMIKTRKVDKLKSKGGNILDLFCTPGLWQMTLIIYFTWFTVFFVYYGLSYNTNELSGDPFVNFAISGAVEFPAYFITMFVIHSQGRKIPIVLSTILGGLACVLTYPLPSDTWFTPALSMVGKFCITAAFAINYVFTAEIFPTPVRIIGLGSASVCSNLGSILAPFTRELSHATNPVVPHVLFGILALLSGLLVLLLPETGGLTVPETLTEAASRRKSFPKKIEEGNRFEMANLLKKSMGSVAVQREGPQVIVQSKCGRQDERLTEDIEISYRDDGPTENKNISTVEINQEKI